MGEKTKTESSTEKEISEEMSQRICQHINEDHSVTVFAMAKTVLDLKPGFKLSGARLKGVTLEGCSIQAITCCNDLCEPHDVVYEFEPKLESSSEARSRLVSIHHQLTKPKISWFITKPITLIIIPVWIFLIWASQMASKKDIENVASSITLVQMLGSTPEEQTQKLKILFDVAFFFTFFGHLFLSTFVVDKANQILKISPGCMIMWVVCVMVSGYPFFAEYYELYAVGKKARMEKYERLKKKKT